MASPQEFQTFVFLDLETTGLPPDRPCMAELSLVAVHRRSLQCPTLDLSRSPQPPRILDKLTLCVDPQKPFTAKAEEITGLSNRTLEEDCKPGFDSAAAEAMRAFLDRQAGPVCLVAHNGLCFDFPLLRTELWRVNADLPPDTGCLDTLPALKDLDQAASKSYRLGEVFRRFYERDPVGAHSAEGDALTLLLVFLARAPELMDWAAVNARSWGEIKPMYSPQSNRL
uniref:three prime repair exonuclease 2 n=1 Tax=Euleptes europaea TaxID=460621 RepID=UPI002540774F|nr:three prime repair exonuclease 2 [Euleptes europaea]